MTRLSYFSYDGRNILHVVMHDALAEEFYLLRACTSAYTVLKFEIFENVSIIFS